MKIMILVGCYPPIINSAARLYSELSESLAGMGHNVTVITKHPGDNNKKVDKEHDYFKNSSSKKTLKGVNLLRVSSLSFLYKIPGGKILSFYLSCLLYAFRGICTWRQDVILVYSPPLYMGISAYIISMFKKARIVFNMQDIHPKVLFDMGVINNQFIKLVLLKMEEICYRKAHSYVVYSVSNRDYLLQKGVKGDVFIIPNWVDTDTVVPSDKMNSFRNEEGLGRKFVISYAGSMGEHQGLEVIVEAAEALTEFDNILFLLAGEGPSKQLLNSLIIKKKLDNILLLPMQLQYRYIQFLSAADVCLLTLSADVPLQTVPGKLTDIMACGRPIIAAVNQEGDVANIIEEAKCGICVRAGNAEELSQAVLRLYKDEGLRGTMGKKARIFTEQNFSRDICTKQYAKVLLSNVY